MIIRTVFLSAALILGLVPAQAKTTKTQFLTYDCKAAQVSGKPGFMGEFIVLRDPTSGAVQVLDAVIQKVHGKPMPVTVKRETDVLLVLGWTVEHVPNDTKQYATLNYTLILQKADSSFTVKMLPLGYNNTFENHGLCTLSQG